MRAVLAVAVGGLIGTGLRWGVDTVVPHGAFPFSTLIVNVLGAFALGVLVARVWPSAPTWLRAGIGTGLLGSFTTFSAYAVSLVTLPLGLAVVYMLVTMVGGLGAAFLGLSLGRRAAARRIDGETE